MEQSIPDDFETLSTVEKLVYNSLKKGIVKKADVATIAKACKLTDIQVIVAIQLLSHKKILPR